MSGINYRTDELVQFAAAILESVGVASKDAELTASSLLVADQRGTSSHGLLRLALYVEAIEQGGINVRPQMHWVSHTGPTALLDADGALGQASMARAVEFAKKHTRDHGVSVVAVQNSSHYGAGAFWCDQLAAEGFISILTSTTGPTVAPFGSAAKVLGTNPLTIAAPSSGPHPLTADMATSTGAYGKVIAAKNEGEELPSGWAVDIAGAPTNDPIAAMAGALTPFGGHKGSAVSVLLEAVAASLGTGSYAHETEDIWSNPAARMNTGHLLIAIDTGVFTGRGHTEKRVAKLQAQVRSSGLGGAPIMAPGDPEYRQQEENDQIVTLSASTSRSLIQVAERRGIPAIIPC